MAGLVAGRLVERFHRPAIALSLRDDYAVGSARSIPDFNIIDAIGSIEDILERFGGHSQAAGFTVRRDRLNEAAERLSTFAASRLETAHLTPALEIDAIAQLGDFTRDVKGVAQLAGPIREGQPPSSVCHPWAFGCWMLISWASLNSTCG